ncbi:MAG: DUF5667 domain-containing protein [Parcubacteria group bacterium]
MPAENIIKQLQSLKEIKPNKDWVNSERELLLSQIAVQSSPKPQSFLVNSWFMAKSLMPGGMMKFVAKPIGVLTVLAAFLFSTGALGVNASKGSLPGDFLYPVKLKTEQVKVGLTAGSEKKAEMHVQFAGERVKEIEKVSRQATTPDHKKAQIQAAAAVLTQEMQKAQEHLEVAKNDKQKSGDLIQVIKSVDEKTDEISAQIVQKQTELKADREINRTLQKAVDAADNTGVKAVEVIVDKNQKGDIQLSENELVGIIEKKIEKTSEQINQVNQAAGVINANAAAVQGGAAGSGGNASQPAGAGSLASDFKDKPAEAKQILSEAQVMLDQGDLTSAIEKVKQSVEITQEAQQTVNEITPAAAAPVQTNGTAGSGS